MSHEHASNECWLASSFKHEFNAFHKWQSFSCVCTLELALARDRSLFHPHKDAESDMGITTLRAKRAIQTCNRSDHRGLDAVSQDQNEAQLWSRVRPNRCEPVRYKKISISHFDFLQSA